MTSGSRPWYDVGRCRAGGVEQRPIHSGRRCAAHGAERATRRTRRPPHRGCGRSRPCPQGGRRKIAAQSLQPVGELTHRPGSRPWNPGGEYAPVLGPEATKVRMQGSTPSGRRPGAEPAVPGGSTGAQGACRWTVARGLASDPPHCEKSSSPPSKPVPALLAGTGFHPVHWLLLSSACGNPSSGILVGWCWSAAPALRPYAPLCCGSHLWVTAASPGEDNRLASAAAIRSTVLGSEAGLSVARDCGPPVARFSYALSPFDRASLDLRVVAPAAPRVTRINSRYSPAPYPFSSSV